ncbi:hypothetical protein [Clostridium sp. BNL1100]|uniref:RipA family octameric membrane protein n=1 Tax=Clostridium sp. BNL1100 TaxID=755731 RepID=UPI00024A7B5F|nr:hypothetical protein [Clostridium sp. BNL1100]AEY65311.1 hypothetical protein Clo1100_1059 [Clostridium sp. BNL1100]
MNDTNYHNVIREMIKEETSIVNNRMNWLILLEGLLFAGYSSLSTRGFSLYIIGILGFVVSLCMRYSILSSEKAIAFIMDNWNRYLKKNNMKYMDFPPVWAGANLQTNRLQAIMTAHRFIPFVFMLAWVGLIINTLLLNLGIFK